MVIIVYYLLCFINGAVLAKIGISPKRWEYWIVIMSIIGAYVCGVIRGRISL